MLVKLFKILLLLNFMSILWGIERSILDFSFGYSSAVGNSTTLCSQRFDGYMCVSLKEDKSLYCGLSTASCVTIQCYLQGRTLLHVMNANNSWYSEEFFIETSANIHNSLPAVGYSASFGSIEHSTLDVSFDVNDLHCSHLRVDAAGLLSQHIPATAFRYEALIANNVEPASWFLSFTCAYANGVSTFIYGPPTLGYLEFTLNSSEIVNSRKFVDHYQRSSQAMATRHQSSLTRVVRTPLTICIWSTLAMDGQKKIWLQQTKHMASEKFRFVWGLSLSPGVSLDAPLLHPDLLKPESVFHHLKALRKELPGLRVIESPFNKEYPIRREDLQERPSDGSPSAAEANPSSDNLTLYRYIHSRLVAAQYKLHDVTPVWCQNYYLSLLELLQREQCDISVYGNSRGFSYNVFITDTARLLDIPAIAELNNMYVDIDVLPDVLVAASTFAAEHDSMSEMKSAIAARNSQTNGQLVREPEIAVISHSVDTIHVFNPELYLNRSETKSGVPLLSVGFVGRLSPEKSPGLFILAAYEVLQQYPLARFIMIGEGELRKHLEQLVDRLNIRHAVSFLGWLSDTELAAALKLLDVVVNTSQRPETFCIANTEVMSMGVPLITFGVGGIGEYVQEPTSVNAQYDSFHLSDNAVLLNKATPEAIAEAVLHLIHFPEVRKSIGQAGRKTVERLFTTGQQMRQYTELYEHWAQHT